MAGQMRSRVHSVVIFLGFAILTPHSAICATWDGDAGNGLWSDPLNWSGNVVPTSTSEVLIDLDGAVVTLDTDFTLLDPGRLRIGDYITSSSATLIVESGRTLTIRSTGQHVNLVDRNSLLSNFGTVNVDTGLTLQLGGQFINQASGQLHIGSSTSYAAFNASATATDETLINHGSIVINGGTLSISSIVVNHGTFDFNASTTQFKYISLRGGMHYGTFHNTATGIFTATDGRIEVGDPSFNFPNTIINDGQFTFGGDFRVHRLITNTSQMDLTGGHLTLDCRADIRGPGTLLLGTVQEGCKLWDGEADDLWSNPTNWSLDSAPTSINNVEIPGGSTVRMDVPFELGLYRTLKNFGAASSEPQQGSLTIEPGVTLTITGQVTNSYGHLINNGRIVNNGTLENEGHQNINAARFDNHGDLENSGTFVNAGASYSAATNVEQFGLFTNYGNINNIGLVENTSGTFTNENTISNPGTINSQCAAEFIDNGVITGNPVNLICATWDGDAGNGLWSDPLNWSGNVVPTSTSEVLIDLDGAVVTLDTDFTLLDPGRLRIGDYITSSSATLIVESGRTLTIRSTGQHVNLVDRNSLLSNFGTVNVDTGLTLQLGGQFINQASGQLHIGSSTSYAAFNASATATDETLINHGSIVINGGTLSISSIVVNHGTFDFNASTTQFKYISLRGGMHYGTFHNTATGIFTATDGRIEVGDPSFNFPNTIINDGQFTFGGDFRVHRLITNTSQMDLTGGHLTLDCRADIRGPGTLLLGTVQEGCKLWDGEADDLWSNPTNWSLDSAPTSINNVEIPGGSTVRMDVPFELGLYRTLKNFGAASSEPQQGSLTIEPGVTLTITGQVTNSYGHLINNGRIVNNGTLENEGHQNINAARFDNHGDLENSGTFVNAGASYSAATNVEQFGLFTNYGNINNIGEIQNTSGTFVDYFGTIANPGSIYNSDHADMVLECTAFSGNDVLGSAPTIISCNESPVADAGPDQILECAGDTTPVTLNGFGSSDPDGDTLSFEWTGIFGTASGGNPTVLIGPLSTHPVVLDVDDGNGGSSSDSLLITVEDTTPPAVDAGPDAVLEAESSSGATHTVTPTADDLCSSTVVTQSPDQTLFPLGATTVTIFAVDDSSNGSSDSLVVTVQDTTPPVVLPPPDIITDAKGPNTSVDIERDRPATATDAVGVVSLTHNGPAVFPIGTTVVTWTATDTSGNSGTETQSVTLENVAPVLSEILDETINEGDTLNKSASYVDEDSIAWTATVDYGDGSGLQPLAIDTTTKAMALNHLYVDNGNYTVTVGIMDVEGTSNSMSFVVTANNVAPILGNVSASPAVAEVGAQAVSASVDFTDPGVLDTHTASIDWGDGSTTPASVAEANGTGIASADHVYLATGVYTVAITVTDNDGGASSSMFQFVVIYDPDGGFVTGGGWIDSPAGACQLTAACSTLTGKAKFGFVSKYKKGATTPTGNTEFQFKAGDLNFHSASYDWLLIAGHQAKYKGSGTINGAGNYGFMLSAIDANLTPSTDVDLFRIKIWDKDNADFVVYDNQMAAAEDDDPTTAIGGGSIVIHKAKKK